ncbi:MAG: FAD:protein FMN transferase [Desulfobacterales bacterium]|nr:FAD:protein FMN transferase [Desulfobacterales bacterium]
MKKNIPVNRLITGTILVAVFSVVFGTGACDSDKLVLKKDTRLMMDTFVTISAEGPEKIISRAIELAFDRMQEIDTKFNIHNPKSPVFAFNNRGTPITDPEILDVIRAALEVSRKSDGAFDITISPLIELWGFYGDSPHVPQDSEIKECLGRIGYNNLVIKNGILEKQIDNMRIDLGGIAKGYNIREGARVLKENGVTSALIDAGGDVYAIGRKSDRLWKVGLRNPRGKELMGYVEIEDRAVMGSGDYERFFMNSGKRYHHIFDSKTGYPASGVTSINLFHPDPMLADAWCTAIFVSGHEKGLELVEKMPDMEAVMITVSGDRLYSSGMKDKIKQILKKL